MTFNALRSVRSQSERYIKIHRVVVRIPSFTPHSVSTRYIISFFFGGGYIRPSSYSNKIRTCYFELRRLASICTFLTSAATAILESAFVKSRIDYCNSLLFGSTHDVTSHLQRVQNYAARVFLRLPKSSNITAHSKSLHWLPVKVRSTFKIACLCYHCRSSTAPSYVADIMQK